MAGGVREIVRGKNSGQAVIKAACRVGEDCEPGADMSVPRALPGAAARLSAVSATTALACPRGRQAQLLPARPAAQAGLAIESDVLVTTAPAGRGCPSRWNKLLRGKKSRRFHRRMMVGVHVGRLPGKEEISASLYISKPLSTRLLKLSTAGMYYLVEQSCAPNLDPKPQVLPREGGKLQLGWPTVG